MCCRQRFLNLHHQTVHMSGPRSCACSKSLLYIDHTQVDYDIMRISSHKAVRRSTTSTDSMCRNEMSIKWPNRIWLGLKVHKQFSEIMQFSDIMQWGQLCSRDKKFALWRICILQTDLLCKDNLEEDSGQLLSLCLSVAYNPRVLNDLLQGETLCGVLHQQLQHSA